jgi:nucleoside 2-deoxyribosyltransferase
MHTEKRIYIASPLGFSEAGRFFMYEKIIPCVKGLGLEVIDPWKLTPQHMIDRVLEMPEGSVRKAAWRELNMIIGENNRRGIDCSDGLFAVLDGCDVDSGTASEIGYAAALGKPVTAYRGDFRFSGDNEGSVVNLQVEYFIYSSGGRISGTMDEAKEEIKRIFISSSPLL